MKDTTTTHQLTKEQFYHFFSRPVVGFDSGWKTVKPPYTPQTQLAKPLIFAIQHRTVYGHTIAQMTVHDVDAKKPEQLPDATATKDSIVSFLGGIGIEPYVYRSSSSGGYHIYTLFDQCHSSTWLKEKADWIADKCRVGQTHVDVYPSGNAIRFAEMPKPNGDRGYLIQAGKSNQSATGLLTFSTKARSFTRTTPSCREEYGDTTSYPKIPATSKRNKTLLALVRLSYQRNQTQDKAEALAEEQWLDGHSRDVVEDDLSTHLEEFNRAWENWGKKYRPLNTIKASWTMFKPSSPFLPIRSLLAEMAQFAKRHEWVTLPVTQSFLATYYRRSVRWARKLILKLRQSNLLTVIEDLDDGNKNLLKYSVEILINTLLSPTVSYSTDIVIDPDSISRMEEMECQTSMNLRQWLHSTGKWRTLKN